jgi:hypothetical protein
VDSVALDVVDYAALALATVVAYVVAAHGVGRQRHGDAVLGRLVAPVGQRVARRGIVEQVRDALMAVSRVPCPTSSPLAAELWIETTARGLPVIAIGALVALAMPVLFSLSKAVLGPIGLAFIGFAAVLPFFSGMSVSFWNRETSLRAPMSTFEAVRPLPTVRLVTVQVGVAVAAIIAAWCLIAASAWWSLPLYGRVVDAAGLATAVARTFAAFSYAELTAGAFVGLVAFSSVVALSAAIRALTARYGLRLWIGAVALLVYLLFVMLALAQEWLSAAQSAAVIGAHLWAVAVAIPVGTFWIVTRTLADGSLRPVDAAILAVVWLLFVAALAYVRDGAGLDGLAAPVAAGALALQLLPLSAGMLAVWSMERIRHA